MLEPYRVLDLTDNGAMICGQLLADLGAEVIAVEPPEGSPARRLGPFAGDAADPEQSLYWWAYARGKRGITLDLESESGRERFRDLVRSADFVIESSAPGCLDSLGLGYEPLAELNPRLILVSVTPFGQTGPKAHWAASDLTALAASHTLYLTGDDDRPPVRVVVPQAMLHAGAEAAVAALAALAARERDGIGQHVDVSAQTAAMMACQSMVLQHAWGDRELGRTAGGVKLGPFRFRFVYPCQDGYVSVTFLFGTAIGPFTRRLMEWICAEGFVDEATRDKDWLGYALLLLSGQEPISELERVLAAVEQFTLSKTKAELYEEALRRGLLIVPVSTTADIIASEQLAARDYWTEVQHDDLGRAVTYPGPFAKLSATPIHYRGRAPRIGEHNDDEFGRAGVRAFRSSDGNARARENARTPVRPHGEPPLAGVKVLDFTWVMVGPIGIRYLADYGATVVHVESATRVDTARTLQPMKDGQPGPERSGLYQNANAGKLGLTLNLAMPEARALALRLVEWADVVTESYSPKAMRAWGLTYEDIRKVNPGVIMLSTSLNGQTGPHSQLAGYGTMGAVLAGFGELAGWPDRPPAGPFGAYTDYVAPKMIAAAILAALDHKRRTGEGQYIDLSQAEASIHFLTPALLDYTVNGRVQSRAGNVSPEHAPHGVYPCAGDDRWIAIVCETDEQWQSLAQVAGEADWATDGRFATLAARLEHREALDTAIGGWTAAQTADALEECLQAAGVPVHRVTSSADAFADPQLQHRAHFVEVEAGEIGRVSLESSRARLSRTHALDPVAAPSFGRDNDHVLRDILGLDDEAITELIVAGALE